MYWYPPPPKKRKITDVIYFILVSRWKITCDSPRMWVYSMYLVAIHHLKFKNWYLSAIMCSWDYVSMLSLTVKEPKRFLSIYFLTGLHYKFWSSYFHAITYPINAWGKPSHYLTITWCRLPVVEYPIFIIMSDIGLCLSVKPIRLGAHVHDFLLALNKALTGSRSSQLAARVYL